MKLRRIKLFSSDDSNALGNAVLGAGVIGAGTLAGDALLYNKDKYGREILSEGYKKKAQRISPKIIKAKKEAEKIKADTPKNLKGIKNAEQRVKDLESYKNRFKDQAQKVLDGRKLVEAEKKIINKSPKQLISKSLKNNKKLLIGATIGGGLASGISTKVAKDREEKKYIKDLKKSTQK